MERAHAHQGRVGRKGGEHEGQPGHYKEGDARWQGHHHDYKEKAEYDEWIEGGGRHSMSDSGGPARGGASTVNRGRSSRSFLRK